mmetsp:Transcript_38801/g.80589  ORF Transcript_38801/g.80589 Transcript_38801/m.80589 type:complete len:89 (-) Transcript_38801:938-1204(-)
MSSTTTRSVACGKQSREVARSRNLHFLIVHINDDVVSIQKRQPENNKICVLEFRPRFVPQWGGDGFLGRQGHNITLVSQEGYLHASPK